MRKVIIENYNNTYKSVVKLCTDVLLAMLDTVYIQFIYF